MALAYLLDPFLQYQNRAGVNNVAGYLEVFRMDTDDRATVYTDFNGTLAPEHIGIDNDGYAVMIVESGIPYRVELHGPNGDLYKTQQPVWPLASGGGVSGTDIVSSDGSIAIDKTTVGSFTTYDLSSHVEDGTDLLEWIKTEGYTAVSGNMVPTYQAGSMEVYPDGIRLYGNRYYHLTGRIKATVHVLQPSYNEFKIVVRGWDGEAYTTYLEMPAVIDGSMGSTQEWEFSTDIMPDTDSDISVAVSGLDGANNSVGLLDMEVHRVYSGAPYIPGSVASRPWVEENYQEKLTPGDGIEIDENNVISATAAEQQQADWAQSDTEAVDYIKNKPTIPSGSQLVPSATPSDAGEVLTVDQNGDPTWAAAQAPISAGNGIDITSNTVSAKVDGSTITFNASGEMVASGGGSSYTAGSGIDITNGVISVDIGTATAHDIVSLQSDGTITDSGVSVINLVHDANYVHTDNNYTNADATKLSGIATGAEVNVQSDWNQTDNLADDYIKNKPSIPVVPTLKPVVAGTNITITENTNDVTIAATDTTYSAGNGISISGAGAISVDTTVVATQSDIPVIGTITL